MTMTPRLRKFALTTHVISSVGWLGAVAGSLALAVAGLTSQDAQGLLPETTRGWDEARQARGRLAQVSALGLPATG